MSVTGSRSICEPVLGPCFVSPISAMQTSESERSDDDSDAGNDPRQSSTVLKSSLHDESDYAAGSSSVVPATPEKSFEEQDGQSDGSEHHSPAQPFKRRCLPTCSPTMSKGIHPVPAQESDSDGVERAYQAQFKFHCWLATKAGKLCLPLNIFV